MKKQLLRSCSLIILIIYIFSFSVFADSSRSYNWYIKRCGNSRPKFPENAELLKNYDAYFIDEKHGEDSEEKKLYLTFDAGYENGNIEKILDCLREENVPAAFFLLDNIILKNTDLVKRMHREGHLVCNHTKRHKDLTSATEEEIAKDLLELETLHNETVGYDMAKYFRFPEGKYSIESLKTIQKLGYKTVFWSFGYEDWDNNKQPSESYAIEKILSNTHNGEIILLHPTSDTNARILPKLIKEWRKMGYTFGSLEEL